MNTETKYMGMSYEDASREAGKLIAQAHDTGRWWEVPEKLVSLRFEMEQRMATSSQRVGRRGKLVECCK